MDILTYVSLKPKEFPKHVIGRRCKLDSDRFCCLISENFSIPETHLEWILGENGNSSMFTWSGVNAAGVTPEMEFRNGNCQGWQFERNVNHMIERAFEVIKLKVSSNWATESNVAKPIQTLFERHLLRIDLHRISQSQQCWHLGPDNSLLWGHPVHVGYLAMSLAGIYLLVFSSSSPLLVWQQKCLQMLRNVCQGT